MSAPPGPAHAQSRSLLRGRVVDTTGASIRDATVEIEGTFLRTLSQPDGTFAIAVPPGSLVLVARRLGFHPGTVVLTPPHAGREVVVRLQPAPAQLKAIAVIGARTPLLAYTVTEANVKQVPALAEPDIFRALVLLPAVSQPNDLKGRIHLAGGSSDETGVRLDGHPLQDPFHLLGVLGAFNVATLDRADVMVHHVPASLGGRLSGVVDLRSRAPGAHPRGAWSLGVLSSGVTLNHDRAGGVDVLAAARITYLDRIAEAFRGRILAGNDLQLLGFHDALVRAGRSWHEGRGEILFFHTRDNRREAGSAPTYHWGETLFGARAQRGRGRSNLDARIGFNRAGASFPSMSTSGSGQFVSLISDWLSAGLDFSRTQDHRRIDVGVGIDLRRTDQEWRGIPKGFFSDGTPRAYRGLQRQAVATAFAQSSRSFGSGRMATLGLRIPVIDGRAFLEPRAVVSATLRRGLVLEAAYNRRLQADAEFGEPVEGTGRQPLFLLAEPRVADVGALVVRTPQGASSGLEMAAFTKRYRDRTRSGSPDKAALSSVAGPGDSLFDRVTGSSSGGTISVLHSFSRRLLVQGGYTFQRVRERVNGELAPTAWDATHQANLFANLDFSRAWAMNAAVQARSGTAITPVMRIFAQERTLDIDLNPRYIALATNSARLAGYVRADMALRRTWMRGKREWAVSLQALNIFWRRNPLAYDWPQFFCERAGECKEPKPSRSGLPFLPSAVLEIRW